MPLLRLVDIANLKAVGDVQGLIKALALDQRDAQTIDVRAAAARALGLLGDRAAFVPLIVALDDASGLVQEAAAEALGEIGDPRATKRLARAAGKPAVTRALVKIGRPAVEILVVALKDEDRDVRTAAALALGEMGGTAAIEPLIAVLGDPDEEARTAAILACVEIGAPAIPFLTTALSFAAPIREAAALALRELRDAARRPVREIGETPAMQPLIAALSGERWDVRKAAAERLVTAYRAGKLDEAEKAKLLAQRGIITRAHQDEMGPGWDHPSFVKYSTTSSDCHTDVHTDEGIGVEFPI